MAQNINQFKQTPVVGDLDLQTNPNPALFTCLFEDISATANTTLVPGEGVILVDAGANDPLEGPPLVDERAANTDAIFGVNIYKTEKNASESGDKVQIAGSGAVVYMNAGAAILRGAAVELVLATPGNVITQSTGTTLGTALDKATAADQVIRVLVS